jgi:hypothetical protein
MKRFLLWILCLLLSLMATACSSIHLGKLGGDW